MRPELLDYLVCPACQRELSCHTAGESDSGIETGSLICSGCHEAYPILRGVPRFVTSAHSLAGDNARTVEAFGWQWNRFRELHDIGTYRNQFLDWISPIQADFFRGKVVLDAGCGMGRFSLVSSRFGAKAVLAVDAGEAVEAARGNTRNEGSIHVIQADLHRLPLRCRPRGQVDFAFSIGVLHHLDRPRDGFEALTRHLRRGGTIFIWVYGRENNDWVVRGVDPLRTRLTSRLPHRALYALSWLIAAGLHPVLKILYAFARSSSPPGRIGRLLPYRDYLGWLAQFGFRHTHHVVFDHLVAPVAHYLRREELESWFNGAGLRIIDISWRNRNSWRVHGCAPEAE